MESQQVNNEEQRSNFDNLRKVTPLSKYLAMALFVALPFIGGWIGYTYAPEKVVEVERVVVKEPISESKPSNDQDPKIPADWPEYEIKEVGVRFNYPPDHVVAADYREFEICENDPSCYVLVKELVSVVHESDVGAETEIAFLQLSLIEESAVAFPYSILRMTPRKDFTTGTPFESYSSSGEYQYSNKVTTINNIPVVFHKRNGLSMIGNVYYAHFLLPDGKILSFSSELDNEILDKIYHSVEIVE